MTASEIITAACRETGIAPEDIKRKTRREEHVTARKLAGYAMREVLLMSFNDIAFELGYSRHCNVIYHYNSTKNDLSTKHQRNRILNFMTRLNAKDTHPDSLERQPSMLRITFKRTEQTRAQVTALGQQLKNVKKCKVFYFLTECNEFESVHTAESAILDIIEDITRDEYTEIISELYKIDEVKDVCLYFK